MSILLNIDVPDIEEAAAFYQAALGLRLRRVLDDDVAELEGAGVRLFLLQKATGSPAHPDSGGRRYTRHWTPVHADFVVEDLEAATQRALAAGARQEGTCIEWRGSRCNSFADPYGHGFCLIWFEDHEYR